MEYVVDEARNKGRKERKGKQERLIPFNWLSAFAFFLAVTLLRFVIFFRVVLQNNWRSVLAGLWDAK